MMLFYGTLYSNVDDSVGLFAGGVANTIVNISDSLAPTGKVFYLYSFNHRAETMHGDPDLFKICRIPVHDIRASVFLRHKRSWLYQVTTELIFSYRRMYARPSDAIIFIKHL